MADPGQKLSGAGEVLRISNLQAWYGESHVLHGVDLTVHKGEVVTLLGRNGAGRTSTLKSILGLVGARTGSIVVNGVETVAWPTYKIAHLGVGYCPEERGIFSSLSVEENLTLPPEIAKGGMSVDEIYEMFPNLRERRKTAQGTQISGNVVKIGILTDMSSLYADLSGQGSVLAAKMAIEDFKAKEKGLNVEVVFADHQNKADVGSQIANKWYDSEGVDVIVDTPNSGVALAVNQITKDKGKVFINSGAATSDLTGKACSPNTVHWTYDTWMLANDTGKAIA